MLDEMSDCNIVEKYSASWSSSVSKLVDKTRCFRTFKFNVFKTRNL
jgi:hypothetical protein